MIYKFEINEGALYEGWKCYTHDEGCLRVISCNTRTGIVYVDDPMNEFFVPRFYNINEVVVTK